MTLAESLQPGIIQIDNRVYRGFLGQGFIRDKKTSESYR